MKYLSEKNSKDRNKYVELYKQLTTDENEVESLRQGSIGSSGQSTGVGEHGRVGESTSLKASKNEKLFGYSDWQSNDVGIGEPTIKVWNSESGSKVPDSAESVNNEGYTPFSLGVLSALYSIACYSEYQNYEKAIDWHEPEFAKSYVSLAQKNKVECGISAFIALNLVIVGVVTLTANTDSIQKEYNYQFYLDQITKLK